MGMQERAHTHTHTKQETGTVISPLMLGPGICETKSGLHVKSLKPHVPIIWRKPEQGLPRAPRRALKSHRGVKIQLETQGSTNIGHSGPHDLRGHRAIIRPDLPLFFLFPSNSPRGEGCRASSDSSLREELTGPAHSSNSNQLQGGELQLPTHLTMNLKSGPS